MALSDEERRILESIEDNLTGRNRRHEAGSIADQQGQQDETETVVLEISNLAILKMGARRLLSRLLAMTANALNRWSMRLARPKYPN